MSSQSNSETDFIICCSSCKPQSSTRLTLTSQASGLNRIRCSSLRCSSLCSTICKTITSEMKYLGIFSEASILEFGNNLCNSFVGIGCNSKNFVKFVHNIGAKCCVYIREFLSSNMNQYEKLNEDDLVYEILLTRCVLASILAWCPAEPLKSCTTIKHKQPRKSTKGNVQVLTKGGKTAYKRTLIKLFKAFQVDLQEHHSDTIIKYGEVMISTQIPKWKNVVANIIFVMHKKYWKSFRKFKIQQCQGQIEQQEFAEQKYESEQLTRPRSKSKPKRKINRKQSKESKQSDNEPKFQTMTLNNLTRLHVSPISDGVMAMSSPRLPILSLSSCSSPSTSRNDNLSCSSAVSEWLPPPCSFGSYPFTSCSYPLASPPRMNFSGVNAFNFNLDIMDYNMNMNINHSNNIDPDLTTAFTPNTNHFSYTLLTKRRQFNLDQPTNKRQHVETPSPSSDESHEPPLLILE